MFASVHRQILRYGIGLLIGSGLLLWYAYREWNGRQGASASPEAISLEHLIARGLAGNPHLLVRDFVPCSNYVAVAKERGEGWEVVYVPMIPGKLPAYNEPLPNSPDSVEALIRSNAANEQQLKLLRNPSGIKGMVINSFDPLPSRHRAALQEHYPGIDLTRCLILEEGRQPANEFSIQLAAGFGCFLLLGGILLLVWAALLARGKPAAVSGAPSIEPRAP